MTAIELLAATALCALLMSAVIGVLVSLTSVRHAIADEKSIPRWAGYLSDQIRWDLSHANQINWKNGQLSLRGFMGRDFATDKILHCQAAVTYRIQPVGGIRCLMRQETHVRQLTNQNSKTEAVAFGVAKFRVISHGIPFLGKLHEVPDTVAISLATEDGELVLNDRIHLR